MFEAAARALAEASPSRGGATWALPKLLPPVAELRSVARQVANAVGRCARDEGLCPPLDDAQIAARIDAKIWRPAYRPYRYVGA